MLQFHICITPLRGSRRAKRPLASVGVGYRVLVWCQLGLTELIKSIDSSSWRVTSYGLIIDKLMVIRSLTIPFGPAKHTQFKWSIAVDWLDVPNQIRPAKVAACIGVTPLKWIWSNEVLYIQSWSPESGYSLITCRYFQRCHPNTILMCPHGTLQM